MPYIAVDITGAFTYSKRSCSLGDYFAGQRQTQPVAQLSGAISG